MTASHLLLTIIFAGLLDGIYATKVTLTGISSMSSESEEVFSSRTNVHVENIEIGDRVLQCGNYGEHVISIEYCGTTHAVENCESAVNTCLLSMPPVGTACVGNRFLKDDCCGICQTTFPKDFSCGSPSDFEIQVLNKATCEMTSIEINVITTASPSTATPTAVPTVAPTAVPTVAPTAAPTATPPTATPTAMPTVAPTALPTLTPTSIPTVAPSLSPTAIPANPPLVIITNRPAGVVTSVPTVTPTSGPTAVPVSTFVPTLTPVGTTKQPVVSTQQPVTSTQQPVISTKQPVVVTGQPVGVTESSVGGAQTDAPETLPPSYYPSEGDKNTAAVAQTAVSSGLGVGAVVGSAASPNIALLSAITNSLDCMGDQSHGDGVREESNLSFFLHPLRFRVEGSPHAGSIVGNICFSFVVALIVTAVVRVVMKRKDLTYEMASATLRYPSCTEIMPMFLYGSILQSSLEMILYPRGAFFVILSTVGLLCCLVFAYVVWKVGEPTKFAATLVELQHPEQVPGWKKYFFGTAAWKSDSDEPQFVERQGIFFDVYRQVRWKIFNNGRYMVFEVLILFPVTVISIIRAKSFTACAVKAFSMATVMLIACIVHWINEPFIIPFLNQLMLMVQVASLLSLILFGVGYVKEDMKTWEITTGYYLITLSLGLAMVRVVYDVLMWLLSVRSNYRKELVCHAGDVWSAKDSDSSSSCGDEYKLHDESGEGDLQLPQVLSPLTDAKVDFHTPSCSSFYFKSPTSLPYSGAASPKKPLSFFPQNSSTFAITTPKTPMTGSGFGIRVPSDLDLLVSNNITTPTATPGPSNRPSPLTNPIAPPRRQVSVSASVRTVSPMVNSVEVPCLVPNDIHSEDDVIEIDDDGGEKFYIF